MKLYAAPASLFALVSCCLLAGCGEPPPLDYSGPVEQWPVVGGNQAGQRYSELQQITPANVDQLEVAWVYHTGDVSVGTSTYGATTFQATPLVVNNSMYFCTGFNRIIALDPETGAEHWTYDPKVDLTGVYTPSCRGVAYWQAPTVQDTQSGASDQPCQRRIVSGTLDARLVAVDADTGLPCSDFGDNGSVDLKANLGELRLAEYYVTSTPLVIGDVVVTGAFVKDGQRVDAPPGVVRAFDVRSGELRWAFDPVPPGMEPVSAEQAKAGATFTRATPNSWGQLSADVEKGIIYVPTGGSQPDHYGGPERGGMDYYGTSVVALDASTGKPLWHFQAVHHDLWDYDVAAQPVLFDQQGDATGNTVPGVIAVTKMGHIFLLNRETGEPLFPVEERPVPASTVPGENTSPTQPFPTVPQPIHPPLITEDDIWGIYPGDHSACMEQFKSFEYQGIFTPPALNRFALLWPGLGGGVNWGSVSVNPQENIMVVNSMRVPYTAKILPREQAGSLDGNDLVGVNPQEGTPYIVVRGGFLSPHNTPCTRPPWGVLTAINLDSGETLWEKPLGNLEELAPMGVGKLFNWGTPNTGGTLQTATGLVFVAATLDGYIRAFDVHNGTLLWQDKLPAPAQATPMTYRLSNSGKQYLAIAAGGHGPLAYAAKGPEKLGELLGDALVVYRLPD